MKRIRSREPETCTLQFIFQASQYKAQGTRHTAHSTIAEKTYICEKSQQSFSVIVCLWMSIVRYILSFLFHSGFGRGNSSSSSISRLLWPSKFVAISTNDGGTRMAKDNKHKTTDRCHSYARIVSFWYMTDAEEEFRAKNCLSGDRQ